MLEKTLRKAFLALGLCLLSGCASMFQGSHQNITVAMHILAQVEHSF